jgi:dihydropteroate synthase
MIIEKLSSDVDTTSLLHKIGVDSGGVKIIMSKMKLHYFYIKDLHVGAANILKQDALSIGADLAVPKGVITAEKPRVDCLLIGTTKHIQILSKKELAQPFGLKILAKELSNFTRLKRENVKIMGIINANSDSFYKNSRFSGNDAVREIKLMIEDGADIIDVGGVSSRPGSKSVSEEEELFRVKDIIDIIASEKLYHDTSFSIDSYSAKVIEYALQNGFKIANDITGLADDRVCNIVAEYQAQAIIMHMQGTPQTMQINPQYNSVIDDVSLFFEQRIEKAQKFGIKDITLDVGIGFGKSVEDNLKLISHLEHFRRFNLPLLVGASRKTLIEKIDGSDFSCSSENRLSGTLALHQKAIQNGASIIRVHDVKEHVQMLKVIKAIEAMDI